MSRHQINARTARRGFLAPLTLLLVVMTVAPTLYMLVISLTDKQSSRPAGFVGLANYLDLLTDARFWGAFRTTALFTVVAVSIELVVGLAVSLALHSLTRGAALLRAFLLIPMAAAPIAVMFNWRIIFNASFGVVNYLLGVVGVEGPDWTGTPSFALPTLIIVDVWQWTPFMIIILVGGLSSLPDDVYEAGAVDGASTFQIFRHLTLPLLLPYILVAVLFRSIDALKSFEGVQVLTGGGPGSATTTLNYFIFQEGVDYLNFGRAAAAAVLLLALAIGLCRALLRLLSKDTAS